MVAEFTVIRGGVKSLIDLPLAATDMAINIDAATIMGTVNQPIVYVNCARNVSTTTGRTGVFQVDYSNNASAWGSFINLRYNTRVAGANNELYAVRVENGPTWLGYGPLLYGLDIDWGRTRAFPAGIATGDKCCGVRVRFKPGATTIGTIDTVCIGEMTVDVNRASSILQPSGISVIYNYTTSQVLVAYTARYFRIYMSTSAGITITHGGAYCYYHGNLSHNATATITNGFAFSCFSAPENGEYDTIQGTIGQYTDMFRSNLGSGSTLTTPILRHDYANWNISAMTVATYAAVFCADINANNRAFPVYGSRIYINGIIGANATWRGHYLNANGVTCGAGQTFYGIDLDLSAITPGGTINGIRCIVPNLIPAMVLGDGVETLTINFGASNYPNIDSSTGRIYFGTQAGGSAAADLIYCKNVYQAAPWAENTWDALDDLGMLWEINMAVSEHRTPSLPQEFVARFNSEGYYNRLQMDALERGAILKLEDRIKQLEEEVGWLRKQNT